MPETAPFFQEFVTEKAMMTLLGIENKKEMDYLVNQRKFPAVKVKGSKRCFHLPSVRTWLSAIDGDDIEHYKMFRRKGGLKDSTIDDELRILKNMYNLAIKRRKIPFEFKPPEFFMADETNPRRMVSLEEFQSLPKHSDNDFKYLLTCAWCTGMRISEILGLTAGQIYLNENFISDGEKYRLNYIYLRVMETKTKTERIIPVDSMFKAVLIRRLKGLQADDSVLSEKANRTCMSQYRQLLNGKFAGDK